MKIHFEPAECRTDLLAMEHIDDEIHLDLDVLVLLLFEEPFSGNQRRLSIASLTIMWGAFQEMSPRNKSYVVHLRRKTRVTLSTRGNRVAKFVND